MHRETGDERSEVAARDEHAEVRICRRCGSAVSPERHRAEEGVTWLWRCTCGWASARTDSGVVSRARARAAIARALDRIELEER